MGKGWRRAGILEGAEGRGREGKGRDRKSCEVVGERGMALVDNDGCRGGCEKYLGFGEAAGRRLWIVGWN